VTRGRPEADLQRQVVSLLRMVLPVGAIVHHSANEQRSGGRVAQGIALGMGVHPGFADLIVLCAGRVLFLELKSKTGRLSPEQVTFRAAALDQGHGWALVRSLDDALTALAEWGIPTRIRAGL
jgi:hypothetical protein